MFILISSALLAVTSTTVNAKALPLDALLSPTDSLLSPGFPGTSGLAPPPVDTSSLPVVPISTDVPASTATGGEGGGVTFNIAIPSNAPPLTTTVTACTQADGEVIDSFVVIGIPTGTFSPGAEDITIIGPPQADPTTITVYDAPPSNATEVIVFTPLPGNCGPIPTGADTTSEATTGTQTGSSPSATADVCPKNGCDGAILRAAETVINAINQVTQLSFALQAAAKKIGASPFSPSSSPTSRPARGMDMQPGMDMDMEMGNADFLGNPITDIALGLTRIVQTVQTALPSFITFPPFPPSCSSDTIVLAWLEFVRVHQELLAILIGRSGLLENGPFVRRSLASGSSSSSSGVELVERSGQGFIGRPIAIALRALEAVVDTLAVGIVDLVPGRSECSKAKSKELKEKIAKARISYSG